MKPRRVGEPWATPVAVTRPVFLALAGLIVLGMVAVLGGAAVREHLHPDFRPDWAVWAPTTLGIGLGILGLGSLALLAQRLPPRPVVSAGPLPPVPPPIAPGTVQALRRGGPLTEEQAASAQQAVDAASDRRALVSVGFGPVYLLIGVLGVVDGSGPGWGFVTIGAVMTPLAAWALLARHRTLRGAATLGIQPVTAAKSARPQN